MQSGAKKVSYEPADPDCKTNLKTTVRLIGPDGKKITATSIEQTEDGTIPTWENLPEGSKIEWEALTESDGKGESDRLSIEIYALDMNYIARITDEVMNGLTPEEDEMLLEDTTAMATIIMDRTMEAINDDLVMKSIYSSIVNTGDDGTASGVIVIPSQWPKGSLSLIFGYGYHRQSEGGGGDYEIAGINLGISAKVGKFWVEEMGPTLVGLALLAVPGVGFALGASLFAAEMLADQAIGAMHMAQDGAGLVGLNKYDCAFPTNTGGWFHAYAIGYETDEATEEIAGEFSPENEQLLTALDTHIKTQGIVASALAGSLILGVFLIMLTVIKTKKKKKGGDE